MKHHLCHIFPNFGTGGPEVRTVLLMNALADQFRHTIVALNGNLEMKSFVPTYVEATFLERSITGRWWPRLRELGRLIKETSPDLLLTYGWGGTDALIAARIAGARPVIHTEDGFLPDEANRQKRLRLYFRRLAFRSADRLIVPSRTLETIAKNQWRISGRVLSYIPNGVNTDRFSPNANRKNRDEEKLVREIGLDPTKSVIGTIGALRPEKNHARLLQATAKLIKLGVAQLLLVGNGCERERLLSLAQQLGIQQQVHFVGHIADPAPYYRLMDVFALTSDTEQMPISLLEAMASGLPVAATNVGDVLEMVADTSRRFIVPVADEDQLEKALEELTSNLPLRTSLGADNRLKCINEYSEATMIARYAERYLATIETQRNSSGKD
jgi:L-malate glycosyltransferase